MTHTFTSLQHPVEKLLEAEYFLIKMNRTNGLELQFELNAFLSASRSVTFVLQNSMSRVPGFSSWYEFKQEAMKADPTMRFFLELRNISQKQGPISFIGGLLPGGRWSYRFVGGPHTLPKEFTGLDLVICCRIHLVKLAQILLECVKDFPFYSCPNRAFTEEGMADIGYKWSDIEAYIGLPSGYIDFEAIPTHEKLRILSHAIQPLDTDSIERIAADRLNDVGEEASFRTSFHSDLVDRLAEIVTRTRLKL